MLSQQLRAHKVQLAALLAASQLRQIAVLAWGRNVEGQCGIEGQVPLVARPTAVLDLYQSSVSSLAAGKLHSAAVLQDGVVYTFGDGAAGKTCLGSAETVASPSRVEAFVGRTSIRGASLGHHHSLFLDHAGSLWACGELKEGQCGLDHPLELLASQHRRAFYEQQRPPANGVPGYLKSWANPDRFQQYLRAAAADGSGAGNAAAAGATESHPYVAQGWGSLSRSSSSSQQQRRPGFAEAWGRGRGFGPSTFSRIAAGGSGGWGAVAAGGGSGSSSDDISRLGMLGGVDLEAHLHGTGLLPGQTATPAKVGAGQSSFMQYGVLGSSSSSSSSDSELGQGSSVSSIGTARMGSVADDVLGSEVVVGMSASKYFSLAVTDKGEVWAFGADYNGALGSEASWVSRPRRVAGPILEALAAGGGAVSVAAGGTFGAALTARGRVVVWGKVAGGSPATPGLTAAGSHSSSSSSEPGASSSDMGLGDTVSSSSSTRHAGNGSSMFAEVCLPEDVRITSIAAGQQHLLLSDGQCVWVVGRWLDAAGDEVGVASWEQPHKVLDLSGPCAGSTADGSVCHCGSDSSTSDCSSASTSCVTTTTAAGGGGGVISKVVAGMHSSAALTADGRLWLWGRLVDQHHGTGILRRFGGDKHAAGVDWGWCGFGGSEPALVEELVGVRDVALGGWHALVLVD